MIAPVAEQQAARPSSSRSAEQSVAVQIRDLSKTFGQNRVLADIDLEIRRGEFVVLLGPSGTGKTTLLRVLAGLELPDRGTVLVPQARTVVFQEPRLVPSLRVLQNVILGQKSGKQAEARALAALDEVRLRSHAQAWPATLSGGEAQRVALARALVREPALLLLDEPFAALDALTRLKMQDLVGELFALHRPAVLLVTHDVDEAVQLADRILVLRDGRFARDVRVEATKPRDRSSLEFLTHRRALLSELGVDTHRPRLLNATA